MNQRRAPRAPWRRVIAVRNGRVSLSFTRPRFSRALSIGSKLEKDKPVLADLPNLGQGVLELIQIALSNPLATREVYRIALPSSYGIAAAPGPELNVAFCIA